MRSHPRPPVACSAEHVHLARRREGGSSWALTHPLDRSLVDHFSVAYCHRGGYEDLALSPQKRGALMVRRLGGPKAVWIYNQMEAAPSSPFPQNNRTVFAQDSGLSKRCISLLIVLTMMIIHDMTRVVFLPFSLAWSRPRRRSIPLSPPHRSRSLRDSPRPITITHRALAVGLSRGISVARNNGCKTETRL